MALDVAGMTSALVLLPRGMTGEGHKNIEVVLIFFFVIYDVNAFYISILNHQNPSAWNSISKKLHLQY